jgi:hypothetical protein
LPENIVIDNTILIKKIFNIFSVVYEGKYTSKNAIFRQYRLTTKFTIVLYRELKL